MNKPSQYMIKNKITVSFAVVVGLVLFFWALNRLPGLISKNTNPISSPTSGPTVNVSPVVPGQPSATDSQPVKPKPTNPATCRVEGKIKFINPTTYQNLGALISYTGIDSPARQIKWKVSPDEDLQAGPNLVAQLKLPDGQSSIDATLPANPVSKNYTLTASMTYGRLEGQGVVVHEASCTGEVKVTVEY